MDMDIDISWCLTCSKRVANPASPYCSYECRQQDGQGQGPSALASPSKLSPIYNNPLSRASSRRKPSAPTGTRPSMLIAEHSTYPHQRDRRAFSFPASTAVSPRMDGGDGEDLPGRDRERDPGLGHQLRFARRQGQYPSAPSQPHSQPPLDETTLKAKTPKRSRPSLLSNSLHATTSPIVTLPLAAAVESAICSTSEESDDEPMLILASPSRAVNKPITSTSSSYLAPTHATATTYASYLPPVRPLPLPTRKVSTVSRSPSAFLAATSASRSREDILSWAKNVGMRPRQRVDVEVEESEADADADQGIERGRLRSRRRETLPQGSTTPSSSSVLGDTEADLDPGSGAVATTPKGVSALGSALSGLGFGLGFVPFTSSLSLRSPVKAETSDDVVIAMHQGGATPTMSTVSFSEVVDPSIGTDLPESIEMANDAESLGSRSFHRTTLLPAYFKSQSQSQSQSPKAKAMATTPTQAAVEAPAPAPIKPISALWNLSSYIRSFKPFAIAGALISDRAPQATVPPTTAAAAAAPASRRLSSGFAVQPTGVPMPVRSPVPEEASDDRDTDEREMVKSLPMDIIPMGPRSLALPSGTTALEQKAHSRERERSRSRSRSGNSQALLGRGGKGMGVGRQRDNYDFSAASSFRDGLEHEEEEEDERGRSRRVAATDKIVPVPLTPVALPSALASEEEAAAADEGRGRGRRRGVDSSVSRGRSGSRGRKARGRVR